MHCREPDLEGRFVSDSLLPNRHNSLIDEAHFTWMF
jgi:hypothetical protein